jgi:outer membrane protein TolC
MRTSPASFVARLGSSSAPPTPREDPLQAQRARCEARLNDTTDGWESTMTRSKVLGIAGRSFCVLMLLAGLQSPAVALDDPDELAKAALVANPALEARRARIAELSHLASAAGTWSDPVLGVSYTNAPVDSFAIDEHPMSAIQVRVQQTIPPWGWSRLREQVAESRTFASEHDTAEAENQLRAQVFVLYWKLALSRQLADVPRDHVARTEELLRAVHARYETGLAGQHEILRLQVLRDRLKDDLEDFTRSDRELSAALSRTLSRPADAAFRTPQDLDPLGVPGSPSDWAMLARESRPELRRLEESIRTDEAGARLARAERLPDVTLWMAYRVRQIDTPTDDGTDQVSAGVTVPIPWGSWKRSRAAYSARLEGARGGRARLAAGLDRIESELEAIHARWSRSFQQAVAYRNSLTPTATSALEASYADYSVGKADFATLFEAEVELLNLERTERSATVRTHIEAAVAQSTIGAAPRGGQP